MSGSESFRSGIVLPNTQCPSRSFEINEGRLQVFQTAARFRNSRTKRNKNVAFTCSRVGPSLQQVYNQVKHKTCALPIALNVSPRHCTVSAKLDFEVGTVTQTNSTGSTLVKHFSRVELTWSDINFSDSGKIMMQWLILLM